VGFLVAFGAVDGNGAARIGGSLRLNDVKGRILAGVTVVQADVEGADDDSA
jgi:hypothetical protein